MKKLFTFLFLLGVFVSALAQWSPTKMSGDKLRSNSKESFYTLDINQLRSKLKNAEESGAYANAIEISIPVLSGKIERFKIYSAPVMVKELAAQYQLGSYAGVGIDDPSKFIRFSLAPNDFQSMIISPNGYEFIEPANTQKTVYRVFPKTKATGSKAFVCSTEEGSSAKKQMDVLQKKGKSFNNNVTNFAKSSDKKYRTLRLALSTTGEYTTLAGGTAGAITRINATLTRVNGVFEKDLALKLIMQNFPAIIYTNAATDPYTTNLNVQLQQTLTNVVGNANYDIGHVFNAAGGNGNAGCIGCICVNPANSTSTAKGSAFTQSTNPQGDTFDIDYVAHEMGHQLGGTHTFSHALEGAGTNVEPGSGSTIMGYAGITGSSTDVQNNSDPYFHTISINQIQTNLINKTCDVETNITNNPPVIAALPAYTIPKGTAFVLTGSATDPENNPMTFVWEQMNDASVIINNANLGNTATGANFRSIAPSTNATRYFPRLNSVLNGVLNNSNNLWEAVSTVPKTQSFAFTVRDNHPTSTAQQTQTATQTINVGNDGPFTVTSTTVYNNIAGAVTWNTANTSAAPYSVANVKIDYTTNNGVTWVVLSNSTANDGTENLQFTGLASGSTVKIRVSAIGNVFYAIGSATVSVMQNCSAAAPTGVSVNNVTASTANVIWDPATGATYDLRYRIVGTTAWTDVPGLTTNNYTIPSLTPSTNYEVQVAYVCSSVQGAFSASVTFTTLAFTYCPASSLDFSEEWISNVTVTPNGAAVMNNPSAGSSYTDYFNDASKLINLNIGSTGNQISVTKAWSGTQYNEGVTVWIDFNRNAVFETNEIVMSSPGSTTTPVTATFTVPAGAYAGGLNTRMRVMMEYYDNPGSSPTNPCATIQFGEVEDYAVKLNGGSTTPCTAPSGLSVPSNTTSGTTISWTAVAPAPTGGYDYFISTTNTAPTASSIPTGNTSGTSVVLGSLPANTIHYWWVRTNCGTSAQSVWVAGTSFTTLATVSSLPYTQNFTGPNDFTFVSGTGPNKWAYGSAAGNPASSIYISNDNGVTNAYTTGTTATVVHAYKDLAIPTGATTATLFFDWRNDGEGSSTTTNYDYFRVWMVPVSFTPTAGTQITNTGGRIQIAGNFLDSTTWQTYFNPTVNISSFAGQTMRLVFEWRNDTSGGAQPPAAIDNINMSIPTCQVPTNLGFNSPSSNGVNLTWTAANPVPSNGYQYYYNTTGVPPTSSTAPIGNSATSPASLAGQLQPNTTYYWWVRSNCGGSDFSYWMAGPAFTTSQIPATLPYVQPFTGSNDFSFVNGTQTNKWAYGSATGNPANAIYISNDNGVSHQYSTGNTSVVQAYRDFTIPAGSTIATLFFDWQNDGEGTATTTNYDYLRVWMVPLSYMPTAGTQITSATGANPRIQIGGNLLDSPTWQTYFNPTVNISAFANSGMRLVFEWRNDGSGGVQPPGAIDNINFVIPTCQVPTNLNYNTVTATGANITWTAANPAPAGGYDYFFNTTGVAPGPGDLPNGNTASSPLSLAGQLQPNTTYYVWIRSHCTNTDFSFWMPVPSFTTTQIPAQPTYNQPFTGPIDFTFVNGNQTNKWHYGSVAGNPPNAIYVSNDNGVTNAYTITSTSVVHAYRDIVVPPGSTSGTIFFDWKNDGENNYDYLRVWMVPTSYVPTAGIQTTAATGANPRIQIGGNFQDQTTWQTYFNQNLNVTQFAALGTVRLVFEWRNDGIIGTQPPAAVDNIIFGFPTCKAPTNLGVSNVTANGANLTWNPASPVPAGYQYYYNTTGVAPGNTTPPPSGSVTTSPAILASGLQPNTTYYWWVRSTCTTGGNGIWIPGPSFTTLQIPADMPYNQEFTNGPIDFTFVNGNQRNKWNVGAAAGNPANSMYISSDNGVTNDYVHETTIAHTYRDIIIPGGYTLVNLLFDWRSVGENNADYFKVWMVPLTYFPTAGTQITAAPNRIQVGGNFQAQGTWQTYDNQALDVSTFAGGPMRLVFEWRNNNTGGTNPPAAIDNVRLRRCSNDAPVLTVGNVTHNSALVTWPQDTGGASYIIRYRPVGSGPGWTATIPVAAAPWTSATNQYQLNGLSPVTLYEVEVAAVCNNTPGSFSHIEFETKCDPAPPTNFTVTQITANSALVSWSPVLSATYVLEYREVGAATWEPPVNLTTTSYTITGLVPNKTYEVRVASICSGAQNPWTTPVVFTTLPTCDMAPIGLIVTNITMTQAQIDWNAFAGATYVLRWRKVGSSSWTTLNLNTNSFLLTGLTEQTQYEVQVANVCGGVLQNFTAPYVFTTPTIIYCDMASQSSTEEHISNVKVSYNGQIPNYGPLLMNNISGPSNYTDYSTQLIPLPIMLYQGYSDYEISVSKKWASTQYNEAVTVWIDFNRDGSFSNAEKVLSTPANKTTPVTGTFSVPSDTFVSLSNDDYVIMRVAMSRDGAAPMCSEFDNGEVEDYKVLIFKPMVGNFKDPTQITVYPNPTKNTLYVTLVGDGSKYKIYNSIGQLVQGGIIVANKIDVTKLLSGVYVIDVEATDGKKAQIKFIKE